MIMTQCKCGLCETEPHDSDCAVHNEPATPNGDCDCKGDKCFGSSNVIHLHEPDGATTFDISGEEEFSYRHISSKDYFDHADSWLLDFDDNETIAAEYLAGAYYLTMMIEGDTRVLSSNGEAMRFYSADELLLFVAKNSTHYERLSVWISRPPTKD
jgi:hypothetical protein